MNQTSDIVTEFAPLRLRALDAQDLAVLSAHLQDATIRIGDMIHQPRFRRFVLAGSRFDWPLARRLRHQRCGVGLHFEAVRKVMRMGFAQDPERLLHLKAIVFLPAASPSGSVMLSFAGGEVIKLEVECLEAALSDIGPRWNVDAPPDLEIVRPR